MVKRWWWRWCKEKKEEIKVSVFTLEKFQKVGTRYQWYLVPGCSRVTRKSIMFSDPPGGKSVSDICMCWKRNVWKLAGTKYHWYLTPLVPSTNIRHLEIFCIFLSPMFLSLSLFISSPLIQTLLNYIFHIIKLIH